MANLLFTDEVNTDGRIDGVRVYDDGTAVDVANGVPGKARPQTATEAQRAAFYNDQAVLAALAINKATLEQALAGALPGLAAIDTQLAALSTLTLSGTTAQQLAQVQAALRGVGTSLRPMVAGVRRAVRLLSDQLDATT